MTGPVWMRARAEMRERRRALVSAALLFGIFGAAILATFAGARRTERAYPAFLQKQRSYDLLVGDSSLFSPVFWKPDFQALARLPYVKSAVPISAGYVHGGADIPDGTGFIGSHDPNFGVTVNRPFLVRGRLPRPDQPLEVAVPFFADRATEAKHTDIGAFRTGDHVRIDMRGKIVTFTVVGETVIPGELPPRSQFGWAFLVSRAFIDTYATGCQEESVRCKVDFVLPAMFLRFDHRSDLTRFDNDVKKLTAGKVIAPQDQASHTRAVRGSTDLQAVALRLLGLFVAMTGIMIAGQLLARETALGSTDVATLRALGFDRGQLFRLGVLRVVPVAVGASIVSLTLAWLASPIFPRGSVRVIDPGSLHFDGWLLGLGALIVAAIVMLLVIWPARRAAVTGGRTLDSSGHPSAIATLVSSSGMSVSAVAGARLALERGRGRTAVPIFSSLSVVALGIASFVAATTFADSLRAMIDRPALYGVTWDGVITTQDDALNEDPKEQIALSERIGKDLASDPDIEALAGADSGAPTRVFAPGGPVGGISALALSISDIKGQLFPPIVEGRRPNAPDEAVLGPRMIRALGLRLDPLHPPIVGVALQGGSRRVPFRVVGRAVIPPLGNFGELGYGIAFGANDDLAKALEDPSQIPPRTDLIVRWRAGASPSAVIARHKVRFPQIRLGEALTGGKFADAVNFGGVQGAPIAVGGVLAALGAAALAHVLVTSIRRRRRDIAILKTIGFVRGQARRMVAWQATFTVVIAAVVGYPIGLIGGRLLWGRVADGIGVLSRPEVSRTLLFVLPIALVVLANLLAALPARWAAHTRPALVLRSE